MSNEHRCTICRKPFTEHEEWCEKCSVEANSELHHWPALCCPGCGCGSYEKAHATPEEGTPDGR